MITFRGFQVHYTRVESALSKSGLPGLDYAFNPYIGCSHGCIYCYARLYTRNKQVADNWGKIVIVKSNIVDILKREIKRLKRGIVGIGTITDAYQPVEAVYKLTRSSLEILLNHGFNVSIQTKNPLVLRDLDILSSYKDNVDIGFTITTLDQRVASLIEPVAPLPKARIRAVEEISRRGIKSWIFYGPIIRGLNDDPRTIREIMQLAHNTGSILYYDLLHIKPFMKDPLHPLYKYVKLYSREWWNETKNIIIKHCMELGLTCKPAFTE